MFNMKYSENGLLTGQLSFRKAARLRQISAKPSTVSILLAADKDRLEVENFIKDVYANAFGAKIDVHYPVLMSVRDEDGRILAATGFRPARDSALFLEQYLDAPIETVLATPRAQIVEIGNLASIGGGASLFLFAALAAYLHHNQYTQAVVTSTAYLERRFKLIGLKPQRHSKADPALLLSDGEDWGSYYDTQPHVISGAIVQGYKKLQQQLGIEYTDCRPRLFPRLHYKNTLNLQDI